MARNRCIQIRFIRRGSISPSSDDILKLTKMNENTVRISYTEKNEYDAFIDYLTVNYTQVIAYIYRTITLLTLDEDPFQSVQFFVPGYPTLLVGVDKLKEQTGYILEMISSTLLNWPLIGFEQGPDTRTSTHALLTTVGSPQETTDATNNNNGAEST
jgi:hypothetical protein